MRYAWKVLVVLAVNIVMLHPAGVSGQPADPTQGIKNYYAATNSGDFDKALTFYADGAVVKNPLGLFVGKDQIAGWLRQDVQTTRVSPEDFQVVNGNTVITTGKVSLERFQKIGIDQVQYRAEYLIEGDRIKYFSPMVMLTPEQAAKVQAASGGSAPGTPATLPRTGGSPLAYSWVVGLALLLIAGGLALLIRQRLRRT